MYKNVMRMGMILMLAVLISSSAWAAEGFRIGAGMGLAVPAYDGDITDDLNPETGVSLALLDLGYGFTDAISANFRIVGAAGSADADAPGEDFTWAFAEYAIDMRYAFMTDQAFNPFLMIGTGLSMVSFEGEILGHDLEVETDVAAGLDLGGGGQYYFGSTDRWSVAALAYYHLVEYEDAEIDLEGFDSFDADEKTSGGIFMMLFTINYTFRP